MVNRKALAYGPLIIGILTLVMVFIAFPIVAEPIKRLVLSILGMSFDTPERPIDVVKISKDAFRDNFINAYQYCGIGSSQEYCRCPVPLGDTVEKVHLRGQGDGITMLGFFSSEEEFPDVGDAGEIAEGVTNYYPNAEKFGPLCLYYDNPARTDSPPTRTISFPPDKEMWPEGTPDALHRFGIIFFKTDEGKLAWTTNADSFQEDRFGSYEEWATEPAVFWRKSDNRRCFWGPVVFERLFREKRLVNDIPICDSQVRLDQIPPTVAQFQSYTKVIDACLRREPITGKEFTYCATLTIEIPEGLVLQQRLAEPIRANNPPARVVRLADTAGRELVREEYPLGVGLCTIDDLHNPAGAQYGTRQIPNGDVHLLRKQTGEVCAYWGSLAEVIIGEPVGVVAEVHFDAAIPDAVYLSTFLNGVGAMRQAEAQHDDLVLVAAKSHNVNFWLAKAIIQEESGWDATRIGYKIAEQDGRFVYVDSNGATISADEVQERGVPQSFGIMQVTPTTAAQYGCDDAYRRDAAAGIQCGMRVLAGIIADVEGRNIFELRHIIAGYNGGASLEGALGPSADCPGLHRWECLWEDPEGTPNRKRNTGYAQTRDYVEKVLRSYDKLSMRGAV